MGFCYQGKRLCCDLCGTPGARKNACPVKWCQPIACCATCKDAGKLARIDHSACRRIAKRNAELRAAVAAGGLHLTLTTETDAGVLSAFVNNEYGSAVSRLFRATWMRQAEMARLIAMGHTLEITEDRGIRS